MKNRILNSALIGFLSLGALLLTNGGCTSKEAAGIKRGDIFYKVIRAEPTTLNPITSSDAYSSVIQSSVIDSLLTRDEQTYEWMPALAESWTISKDGKIFTFKIRDGVRWSDGQPLTVEDVKFSFDVYFEGKFQAPHKTVYLSGIKDVKIIDSKTVQFETKEVYFLNFDSAAGLSIIPKHYYNSAEPNDAKFNKTLIGTGPYILETWDKGQKIVLLKNLPQLSLGNRYRLFLTSRKQRCLL